MGYYVIYYITIYLIVPSIIKIISIIVFVFVLFKWIQLYMCISLGILVIHMEPENDGVGAGTFLFFGYLHRPEVIGPSSVLMTFSHGCSMHVACPLVEWSLLCHIWCIDWFP